MYWETERITFHCSINNLGSRSRGMYYGKYYGEGGRIYDRLRIILNHKLYKTVKIV